MSDYDAIVVGLGGAGSSAAYHLAGLGSKVLGLERFGINHGHGSSHGKTRIYRTTYFEGTAYVPLTLRAQELWRELERESGTPIIRRTGGLLLGRPDGEVITGALRSAQRYGLAHELLSSSELRRRFPMFRPAEEEVALWDPESGTLFAENCVRAHVVGAIERGAELHYGEKVEGWAAESGAVTVRTSSREYRARSLVLTAGSWTASLVPELALPLEIQRQFVFWFPPSDPALVRPDRMPVFIWDHGSIGQTYGLPDFGDGVKIGTRGGTVVPGPDQVDRVLRETDALPAREFAARSLAGVVPRERESISCLYTNSPDRDFLIGAHPRYPAVVVVSACSGHGFKFTSVVGEVAARLARHEPTGFDLSSFDPARFGSTGPRPATPPLK